MTYRSIAVAPFALTALTVGVWFAVPAPLRPAAQQIAIDASKLLALGGMSAAAVAFERGDYLRRGWGVWAFAYVCFLGRDAMLLARDHVSNGLFEGTRGVLVTVGNACVVLGAWTLARMWSVAGLEHPGSSSARRAIVALAIVAVLLFAGPDLVLDVRELVRTSGVHFDALASDIGDMLSLPLIAPVALTALALQGGTLRWPWQLLTTSLVVWLLYDAVYIAPDYLPLPAGTRDASEVLHVLAGMCAFAAGLAQRKTVVDDDDG
jgi:hypothetical protein